MRKYVFLFLCWLSASLATLGQTTPTITLTTDIAVGSNITMVVKTAAAATIKVDLGNGTLVDKATTANGITITSALVGTQTVKIYGSTITYFDCKNSQVTALDVTQATALTTLFCGSNKLTVLDISALTKLTDLQCYGNQLKTLDVTKNTALAMLDAENNLFTSIDISKNTALKKLFCRNNFLDLASLPLPSSRTWTNYYYAAQKPLAIADSLTIGDTINLASQATVGTVATVYTWKTKAGAALVAGTDYTITSGKTVFLKPQTDSVYCEMTNTAFPNFTGTLVLKTNLVAVYDILPAISFTTEKAIGTEITFELKASQVNTIVKIDFGDGVKVEKIIGTATTAITGTIVGSQTLIIYGNRIASFKSQSNELTAIDVSNCEKLNELDVSTNNLSKLDISKNTLLHTLNCTNNLLTFNALPDVKLKAWTTYSYAPQKPIIIADSISIGDTIKLDNIAIVGTTATNYNWKTKSGVTLNDCIIKNGQTVFLNSRTDSVYCELSNAAFPDFTGTAIMKTSLVRVSGLAGMLKVIAFSATQDAFTKSKFFDNTIAYTNYGTAEYLYTGSTEWDDEDNYSSYLAFTNIEEIIDASDVIVSLRDIKKASLKLYHSGSLHAGNNAFYLNWISGLWDESTITHNNAGLLTTVTGLLVPKSSTSTQNYSIDVTSLLHTNYKNDNNVSFGLKMAGNGKNIRELVSFASKENTNKNLTPSLEVEFYLPALALSTQTLTVADTASNQDVKVFAIKSWSAISNATWLSVSPASGTGKGTLVCSIEANTTKTARTAIITVNAIGSVNKTIIVTQLASKQPQTITFPALPATLEVGKTYDLSATASSKLPVTFSSSNDALASISGSTLTVKHSGTFSITATQAGNDTLASIDSVQTRTVAMPLLMTLVQTKTATSKFYVTFKAKQIVPNNNTITVTFNGKNPMVMNYTSGYFNSGIGTCDTIRIYGDAITTISCIDNALTSVKIEPNTSLDTLILSNNQLTTLDVSKCTSLLSLQCVGNQLKTIDLSSLVYLKDLRCANNQFETLDLSSNIFVTHINAENNLLSSIVIPYCTYLQKLYLYQNKLTTLDVSGCTSLGVLGCHYNKLTIATLPSESSKFSQYVYLPQADLPLAQSVGINQVVDLSSQSARNGVSSSYVWKTKTGTTLVEGTDYTITGGKTTFLKAQTDSVYCEMGNALFKKYSNTYLIKTSLLKVTEKPLATPTISFPSLPATLEVGKTYELSATASSKLPVTFTSSNDALASISGSTLTVKHSGTFSITATQAGNDTLAAIDSVQTRTVDMPLLMTLVQIKTATSKFDVLYKATQIVPNANTIKVTFNGINATGNNYIGGSINTSQGKYDTIRIYSDFITEISCTKNALTSVKIEPNTCLDTLILADNALAVLDANNCSNLLSLQCSGNQLTTLDLSGLQKLTDLRCSRNMLETLDLSANPLLTNINAQSNKLTSINITSCPVLNKLNLYQNKLTTLDVHANPKLSELSCHYNNLNIATLPLSTSNPTQYKYWPQAEFQVPQSVGINQLIDLSSQAERGAYATSYTWKTKTGTLLVAGTDYSITGGKTTFLKAQTDSVYCEMTNATFPSFTGADVLKTTLVKVLDKPLATQTITFPALPATLEFGKSYDLSATASSKLAVTFSSSDDAIASISGTTLTINKIGSFIISATQAGNDTLASASAQQTLTATVGEPNIVMTTEMTVGEEFTLYLRSENGSFGYIDFGDGKLVEQTITQGVNLGNKLAGSVVKVYIEEITDLNCNFRKINQLNVANCTTLVNLNCSSNELIDLDVSNNKKMQKLELGNSPKLKKLTLNNPELLILECYDSNLSILDVSTSTELTALNCSNNHILNLDLSHNSKLVKLDCSRNKLSILDVSNNNELYSLGCDKNNISELNIESNTKLGVLSLNYNNFSFSSLPLNRQGLVYYYNTPQDTLPIAKDIAIGTVLDLSSEYSVGGNTTVYTWISTSGDTLVAGTDYTINEGKTTFLRTRTDSVYCAMTNATFPDFSGEYSLKTTAIRILEKQSISFTALPVTLVVGKTYQLVATASTGAAVSFTSSDPSVASVNGTTLTIHKAGSVTISATVAATATLASATTVQTIVAKATLSDTEQLAADQLHVYPTRTSGQLTIEDCCTTNAQLHITDLLGRLVMSKPLLSNTIDVSALSAGSYIMLLYSQSQQTKHAYFVKE